MEEKEDLIDDYSVVMNDLKRSLDNFKEWCDRGKDLPRSTLLVALLKSGESPIISVPGWSEEDAVNEGSHREELYKWVDSVFKLDKEREYGRQS